MTPASPLKENSPYFANNRRRRNRLCSDTQGWLLPPTRHLSRHVPTDDEAWEVRIHNLSRIGVGFTSTQRFPIGEQHRLRIGRGPMKRARAIRVVVCRESQKGIFQIGAEFIDTSSKVFAKAG